MDISWVHYQSYVHNRCLINTKWRKEGRKVGRKGKKRKEEGKEVGKKDHTEDPRKATEFAEGKLSPSLTTM